MEDEFKKKKTLATKEDEDPPLPAVQDQKQVPNIYIQNIIIIRRHTQNLHRSAVGSSVLRVFFFCQSTNNVHLQKKGTRMLSPRV